MATYIIIGGDKKEYGPVSAEDVGQWIGEGRLNEESLVKTEGDAEFRRLADIPEFAGAFAAKIPPPPAPSSSSFAGSTGWEGRDYQLDLGDCISRGWNLVKNNFWPVVGTSTLVFLLIGGINQIFGLFTRSAINSMLVQHQFSPGEIFLVILVTIISAPVYTIFTAGLFKYYLKIIRGENASISDAFSGFG